MLASGTEIVCALGLEGQLVAISHECDYPPEVLRKPRITRPLFDPNGLHSGAIDAAVREAMGTHGAVYQVDESLLERLQPDLVITQAVCDVCAVSTMLAERAIGALRSEPTVLSLDCHTLDDILRSIVQVGDAAGQSERARQCAESLRSRLAEVQRTVAGETEVSVMVMEWLDPPFAPGHWVPEMIELVGGRCLLGSTGEPSRQVAWSDLAAFDPDVLVVMPCGYGLERSYGEAEGHARWLRDVAPRAINEGRAWVVDGSSYFNRSGPRVVDGIEILAALFHPHLFAEYELDGRAAAWP